METFPDEIVDDILLYTWTSSDWATPKSRWSVYRKVLGLSRQWNRIIRSVVLQYRYLETLVDFQVYSHLRLPFAETITNSHYPYLRISYNDTSLSYLHVFGLESYLYHCDELDIPPQCGADLWKLFHSLAERESAPRRMSVALEGLTNHYYNQCQWSTVALPSVAVLNITSVKPISWYWDIMDFKALLASFPNLVHLHTDAVIDLRRITESLQTVRTLTLDISAADHASPLMPWRLQDVLEDRAFQPEKVVIESGPFKPKGWGNLCAVCDTVGVMLVHAIKEVDSTPNQLIPFAVNTTNHMRGLEVVSLRSSGQLLAITVPLPVPYLRTICFLMVMRKRGLDEQSYQREVGQSNVSLHVSKWTRWCLATCVLYNDPPTLLPFKLLRA